jgi:hypothetical protein
VFKEVTMELNVPPVGGADGTGGPARAPRAAQAAGKSKDFSKELSEASDVHIDVPATPPEGLRAEMARAAARQDELRSTGREMHFATDPDSGRLVIQVRDLDGNVLRTLPPSQALDVISGAPLEDER